MRREASISVSMCNTPVAKYRFFQPIANLCNGTKHLILERPRTGDSSTGVTAQSVTSRRQKVSHELHQRALRTGGLCSYRVVPVYVRHTLNIGIGCDRFSGSDAGRICSMQGWNSGGSTSAHRFGLSAMPTERRPL